MAVSCFALSVWAAKCFAQRNFIYTEEGIIIFESAGLRCLTFGEVEGIYPLQGCAFKKNPKSLVFDYTKLMMMGMILNPAPSKILMLGLGIGSIPMALSEIFQSAQIDIIEIDKRLPPLAEKYFGFRETDKMKVTIQDAYDFILNTSEKYDVILMDVFDGVYIPEKFLTMKFIEHSKQTLAPGGIFIMNTFTEAPTFIHEANLIKKTFGNFLQLISSNRIIITQIPPFSISKIEKSEKKLRFALKKAGIDSKIILQKIDKTNWHVDTKLETF